MDKITILTPVHIATGNDIEMPCYHEVNDVTVNRYRFTDILSQLPPKVLTDPHLLNELSSGQPSKKLLYRYIHQYVDYSKLTPLYNLEYTYNESLTKARNDVSEQMHDLHKPFIPGSTIKGTLLNSWKYYLLKSNYDQIRPNIYKQIKDGQNKNLDFHELRFGKSLDKDHENFYKELYSCLQCQDIYFNEMELFFAGREGSNRDMSGSIPTTYKECIPPLQTTNLVLFHFDEFKLKHLKDKYKEKPYSTLVNSFKRDVFFKACNAFTKDILNVDMDKKYFNFYERFVGINEQLNEIKKELENPNTVVLRVGNSTNYFAKTVSYLIKYNDPGLYKECFWKHFAPVDKGKTKPNERTMPKTRMIYSNGGKKYLPGFIKIQYD